MGAYDTMTVITVVAVVHDGTSIPAGTILSVPAGIAVRWLMQKQATAAPKGSVPTPAPAPVTPAPEAPPVPERPRSPWEGRSSTKPKPAPKKPEARTYQRRDLEPEE